MRLAEIHFPKPQFPDRHSPHHVASELRREAVQLSEGLRIQAETFLRKRGIEPYVNSEEQRIAEPVKFHGRTEVVFIAVQPGDATLGPCIAIGTDGADQHLRLYEGRNGGLVYRRISGSVLRVAQPDELREYAQRFSNLAKVA